MCTCFQLTAWPGPIRPPGQPLQPPAHTRKHTKGKHPPAPPPPLAQAVGDDLIDSVIGDNIPILTLEEKYNETVSSSVSRISAVLQGKEDPGPPIRCAWVRVCAGVCWHHKDVCVDITNCMARRTPTRPSGARGWGCAY